MKEPIPEADAIIRQAAKSFGAMAEAFREAGRAFEPLRQYAAKMPVRCLTVDPDTGAVTVEMETHDITLNRTSTVKARLELKATDGRWYAFRAWVDESAGTFLDADGVMRQSAKSGTIEPLTADSLSCG